MPKIYVPRVPEFASLMDQARARSDLAVREVGPHFDVIEAEGDIVLERKALKFKPACWYSCLVGGIEGRIAEFGRETLRLVDDNS